MRTLGRLLLYTVAAVATLLALGVGAWMATGPPAPDDTPARRRRPAHPHPGGRSSRWPPPSPSRRGASWPSARWRRCARHSVTAPSRWTRPSRSHVLVPGFIDPHIHPTLAATILPIEIVSAMEWTTPRGRTRAVRGREAFLARLHALDADLEAAGEPDAWLSVWGYHAPYHGELSRRDLDAVSRRRGRSSYGSARCTRCTSTPARSRSSGCRARPSTHIPRPTGRTGTSGSAARSPSAAP